MRILGIALLFVIIWFGFSERDATHISAFDLHAFVMVIGGSAAAIMASSSAHNTLRTLAALRETLPGGGRIGRDTDAIEAQRTQLVALWQEGRRAQAVELAERSEFSAIRRMLQLVVSREPHEVIRSAFTDLTHAELQRWQPAIANWELLSKLAPSFGMVGTITGMIQLFKSMGEDTNMGAAISLALLATLYGVAFGAGISGPIGHYLRNLLDNRLGALERCEASVSALIAQGPRGGAR